MGTGRVYTVEFKKQAIELAASLGSVSKAAEQLGIPDVNIHAWRKRLSAGKNEKSQAPVSSPEQDEIKKLKKENNELKQVNLILKTAAAFFSQDHLKKSIN